MLKIEPFIWHKHVCWMIINENIDLQPVLSKFIQLALFIL